MPVFLYALGDQPLGNDNLEDLRYLRETYPYNPVLFVSSLTDITHDNFDNSFSKSIQRPKIDFSRSSGSGSTKEDSMKSTSTQEDSIKTNLLRISDRKKNDSGCSLDKISSLGLTWYDQLAKLGFMSESIDADEPEWLTNGHPLQPSDILDSCSKLGNYPYKFIVACISIFFYD